MFVEPAESCLVTVPPIALASSRLISRTDSGMRPGSAGGAASGPAGGGAGAPVRSRKAAAVTAQTAKAAITSTMCRSIAV